ncbi:MULTISPECIES: DNA double-strand break repair nuclease NurA [unclassified Synechocystis]|uniref:DNA double-strand break repair nuclease NurA n=1 Tax=unclassified Synechocystis TaxID=2640012 RepID=UPI0004214C2D|nr:MULTISPECIES: DNA double-strand break repair nuclease NurA [unclassified Synechocystis]AIE74982.1 hypothetical protein D082_24540 [Synechocystis sp. PCC 6714]MCT0253308.1 DNA double-strand break repair nuclease NurA [Synechocystis sp. CS-94]
MLDLTKLAGQMPALGQHFRQEATAGHQRLERAKELFFQAQQHQTHLLKTLTEWGDRLFFAVATPLEPLDTRVTIGEAPINHSVFATDGSQIAPSHHEIAYCYLLNIGRVMLHYGQNLHPLLDSVPEVYYRPEDLYASRRWGIRTEEWLGHRRTVLEAERLAALACRWVSPPGPHSDPNLAMVDGSLIYWFLENLPQEARNQILEPILAAWETLRQARIPLMSYISAPRSVESINLLRLQACPHESPNCVSHCEGCQAEERKTPCQIFDPLRDSSLWQEFLTPGQRGPIWRSNARILEAYAPEQRVCFCYVQGSSEVARVEFPVWLAEDSDLLNQSLAIVLSQIEKGFGYPVALAEAHNQAVVRGGDRRRFFALLEQQLVRTGLRSIGTSYKEARKRNTVV